MKSFDYKALGLNTDPNKLRLQEVNPNSGLNPQTIYGSSDIKYADSIKVVQSFMGVDTTITKFVLPVGLGTPYGIGLPNIQAAVGVGFGTEVMIRITPGLKAGNFGVTMFGFGFKHSLSQWIWRGNEKPPIDLSVVFGYNKLNAKYSLGSDYLKPDSAYAGVLTDAEYQNSQVMTFEGKGTMFGVVVSKKLSLLTIYAGGNYNMASVDMKMAGKYPVTAYDTDISSPNFGKKVIVNLEDPIHMKSDLPSYFRFNAGLRIKLGPITISGEYNMGPVKTIAAGIGFNLQSIKPFKL